MQSLRDKVLATLREERISASRYSCRYIPRKRKCWIFPADRRQGQAITTERWKDPAFRERFVSQFPKETFQLYRYPIGPPAAADPRARPTRRKAYHPLR